MTEPELKNRLGLFVIASHFGVLLLVLFFWLSNNFLTEEMTTTVAIISPFLATYATAIIRYIIESRHDLAPKGPPLTDTFVLITFAIPGVFVFVIAGAVILKAFNIGLNTFENFKIMLGTAETIFGVYVGQLIFSVFERVKPASGLANQGTSNPPQEN
jgi:hypothetical protein